MKYKNIEQEAQAMELLKQFPSKIYHDRLDYLNKKDLNDCRVGWVNEKRPWLFQFTRCSLKNSNNQETFRLSYALWGYEGPEDFLPYTKEEEEEIIRSQVPVYNGGLEGDDLEELIFTMWNWLKQEKLI